MCIKVNVAHVAITRHATGKCGHKLHRSRNNKTFFLVQCILVHRNIPNNENNGLKVLLTRFQYHYIFEHLLPKLYTLAQQSDTCCKVTV